MFIYDMAYFINRQIVKSVLPPVPCPFIFRIRHKAQRLHEPSILCILGSYSDSTIRKRRIQKPQKSRWLKDLCYQRSSCQRQSGWLTVTAGWQRLTNTCHVMIVRRPPYILQYFPHKLGKASCSLEEQLSSRSSSISSSINSSNSSS